MMISFKKNWWRILILSVIATLVIRFGHVIDGTMLPIKSLPLSSFAKAYGAPGVTIFVTIWFVVIFCVISTGFLVAAKWMHGSKIAKGLKFFLPWGMVYFLGAIEWYPVYGETSLFEDIRIAFVDLIGIVVLALLSGVFLVFEATPKRTEAKNNGFVLFMITFCYMIGRYFAYFLLNIDSGYIERFVPTFMWTLATGVSFGIFYIVAGQNIVGKTMMNKLLLFGLVIAGPSWVVFNVFYPTIFQASYIDMIFGRAVLDIVYVMLGGGLCEILLHRKQSGSQDEHFATF